MFNRYNRCMLDRREIFVSDLINVNVKDLCTNYNLVCCAEL
jgi:hypothetical protein